MTTPGTRFFEGGNFAMVDEILLDIGKTTTCRSHFFEVDSTMWEDVVKFLNSYLDSYREISTLKTRERNSLNRFIQKLFFEGLPV